jgi:protein-tyrosine phosphatase
MTSAQSLEESPLMARRDEEDGIDTIVATPHTLNGIYINTINEVISKVASLQETLSKNNIELRLYAGADVHLCPHMLELLSQIAPPGVKNEIFSLKLNEIIPIITHPERNPIIQKDIGILYEFVYMGALIQVTAMSITGDYGGIAIQGAERLLRHRLVHVIASDAHSSNSRPPILSQAVEAAAEILRSYDDAGRMGKEVSALIISGDISDILKPKRSRRGLD